MARHGEWEGDGELDKDKGEWKYEWEKWRRGSVAGVGVAEREVEDVVANVVAEGGNGGGSGSHGHVEWGGATHAGDG